MPVAVRWRPHGVAPPKNARVLVAVNYNAGVNGYHRAEMLMHAVYTDAGFLTIETENNISRCRHTKIKAWCLEEELLAQMKGSDLCLTA